MLFHDVAWCFMWQGSVVMSPWVAIHKYFSSHQGCLRSHWAIGLRNPGNQGWKGLEGQQLWVSWWELMGVYMSLSYFLLVDFLVISGSWFPACFYFQQPSWRFFGGMGWNHHPVLCWEKRELSFLLTQNLNPILCWIGSEALQCQNPH